MTPISPRSTHFDFPQDHLYTWVFPLNIDTYPEIISLQLLIRIPAHEIFDHVFDHYGFCPNLDYLLCHRPTDTARMIFIHNDFHPKAVTILP
jgi:hypothetical protein